MRRPHLRSFLAAMAFLSLGTALSAQGPGFGRGGMRGLNLTPDQRTQVQAIHDKHQAALQAKAEAAATARKAFHEAMVAPTTDAATLKTLHDKVSAAQFEVMLERRAVHAEILPLLTPDQQTRFQKMGPGQGSGRGRGHRGGGFGSGFGPGRNPDCPLTK